MARFGEREEQAEYDRRHASGLLPQEYERPANALELEALVPDFEARWSLRLAHNMFGPACQGCGWTTDRTDPDVQVDHLIDVALGTGVHK